ncbi:MAG: 4-alpha-glucanotransferase [Planctomycetaceae bacterium]
MESPKESRRQAGVLLHVTSLPGPFGVGDFGPAAYRFLDWLTEAGQSLWQILPLGPPASGASPYQSFSSFAINPLMIALEPLVDDGLLTDADLRDAPAFVVDRVDFERVAQWREPRLRTAWKRYLARPESERQSLWDFGAAEAWWLDDYALFMALRTRFPAGDWTTWPAPLRTRDWHALQQVKRELAEEFGFHQFTQLLAYGQWRRLRQAANDRGIQILGDVPIFVGHNSSDVWARQELFQLDDAGSPTAVAGVPPDYFCEDGQHWGNPLYRWDRLAGTGYRWWIDRIAATLRCVDWLRIDHFRGCEAYWEIPGTARTAKEGQWQPGPGRDLFDALRAALGELPIIAEDLGVITPDVDALRRRLGLPGMRILQFAFAGDAGNRFLPHNHERDAVVYTGTHDNDTTAGWWAQASEHERHFARGYLATDGHDMPWALIRAACASVADAAIHPMQDVLALPSECRMNHPGQGQGWWKWRMRWSQVHAWHAERLAELGRLYGRDAAALPA